MKNKPIVWKMWAVGRKRDPSLIHVRHDKYNLPDSIWFGKPFRVEVHRIVRKK
jgi:hypothetical protein